MSTASTTPVLLEDQPLPGCTRLTLNRPQVKNALSRALRESLVQAITRLAGSEAARVLIITGAGDAFCAGLDLKELGAMSAGEPGTQVTAAGALDVVAALRAFPGPVICAVNGVAITGGFELALNCDVLLASSNARFADTHGRIGLMPGWGLSQLLSRTIGIYRAKELSLTGNFLSAERAAEWGLINRVVASDALQAQAVALAADMLTLQPHMLLAYKQLIDEGFGMAYGPSRTMERERSQAAMRQLDPADVEQARHAVRERGQQQQRGGA